MLAEGKNSTKYFKQTKEENMTNTYEITFNCICPNDHRSIEYHAKIVLKDRMVFTENIIDYLKDVTSDYHERIADEMYGMFGGEQTITALHDKVKITTKRGFV